MTRSLALSRSWALTECNICDRKRAYKELIITNTSCVQSKRVFMHVEVGSALKNEALFNVSEYTKRLSEKCSENTDSIYFSVQPPFYRKFK